MPNLDAALSQSQTYDEITINYVTKQMVIPSSLSVAGVKGDDLGRRLHFRLKKVPDELDLLGTGATIEIHYQNASGQTGRYFVQDAAADGDDEVTFSFPMPASFTSSAGKVKIEVCVTKDSKHWHVSPGDMNIGDFFEAETISTDDPKYDVIAQLYSLVNGGSDIDTTGFLTVTAGDNRYFKKTDPITLTDAQKAELKGAKGDKGDPGTPPTITATKSGKVTTIKADGTTIATINDGNDGANGQDGTWAGVTKVTKTETSGTFTLDPNKVYIFGTMTSLTVTLGTGTSAFDEYHFFFTSGTTATTLTLPTGVKTPEGYSIEASKTYEVSIANNLALIQEWS